MKKTWIIAAALVCLAAACNKNEVQNDTTEPEVATITYIKADGNESDTKGSVDNPINPEDSPKFTWNTGDQIAVWAEGYKISNGLDEIYDGESAANFGFKDLDDAERNNFAIFPAALVYNSSSVLYTEDVTTSSLKLTLPASYTLEQVQGEVSPTPMIAANEPGGDLSFKALCPLLRITVVNIPKQTKRIEFDFNGNKVQGEFTLTSVAPGTTAIATIATEETDDIITVTMAENTTWHNNLVVNLPVPTGTYGDITITAYDAVSGGHSVLKLTKPIKSKGWKPTRKASRKMTATLPVFSVGGGKYITFAPGNLQYQASTNTWRFAENSWDIIGNNAGNNTAAGNPDSRATQSEWIDLFGWGTSGWNNSGTGYGAYYHPYDSAWGEDDAAATTAAAYGPTGTVDLTGTFAGGDWGMNIIEDYPAGTWRTPTGKKLTEGGEGDLYYLLYERDAISSPKLSANGTVNGKKGHIFLPDYFIDPKTSEGIYGTSFRPGLNITGNNYTGDNWKAMAEAGAVFIPDAGKRQRTAGNIAISSVNRYGYYWTASAGIGKDDLPAESTAFRWLIYGSTMNLYSQHRSNGFSVRLVLDLN